MSAAGTVFLMGPTACGKTELAAALVERFPMAIVSVDSALVYRGMDIGTAKPDEAFLTRAPHRMIDVRDPWEPYSASAFATDAAREIADIKNAGLIPLLVGGTGLYFRAIEGGLAKMPPADDAVRAEIEGEANARGWPALHDELQRVDAKTASRLAPNDAQRIQRALEVFRVTGTPISKIHAESDAAEAPALKMAIAPRDRKVIWPRIAERFEQMLQAGLLEEVERLRADPRMVDTHPAMRAVGYRQVLGHLRGEYDRRVMIEKASAATRQLAKRQMTWLRREADLQWLWLEDGDVVGRASALLARNPLIQSHGRQFPN